MTWIIKRTDHREEPAHDRSVTFAGRAILRPECRRCHRRRDWLAAAGSGTYGIRRRPLTADDLGDARALCAGPGRGAAAGWAAAVDNACRRRGGQRTPAA